MSARLPEAGGTPHGMPDPLAEQLLLRMLREISGDAVLSLDPKGQITSWNHGAEVLLGYRADEVVGKHFELLVPGDLKEQQEIPRLLNETEQLGFLRDYETRRVTKDGREVHVSLTRMHQLDEDGQLLGSTAILRDISTRKRMERDLVRASTLAAIGEFAARIAHEIRNPLTGMGSAVSLLSSDFPDDHPHREVYNEIQYQIQRIDRVLDDLLTFARHRPVDRQKIDLVQLLEKVVRLLQASGDLSGVRLQRYLEAETLVSADPTMVEDSFFNLIQNAAQSLQGHPDAEMVLAIKPGPKGVGITITDNGPGIRKELADKIFDPFFTTKSHGTGLGLPITRKHIEAHGGRLRVRSAPGRRTTFEIFLPSDSIAAHLPREEGEEEINRPDPAASAPPPPGAPAPGPRDRS